MFWSNNRQALIQSGQGALAAILSDIAPTTEAQLINTSAGDFTLRYRDLDLHAMEGAAQEASQTINQSCVSRLGRAHLILGLGLGYVVEAAYVYSPGQLIVYEPDLPLLRFVLDNVDLSEYLGSGRVHLTHAISETVEALRPFIACPSAEATPPSQPNESPLDVLVTSASAQRLHQEIPALMNELYAMVDERLRDLQTGLHFHHQWTRQFFQNLPYFPKTIAFHDLPQTLTGKPALIIGRGPSLDAALNDIPTLADRMILIAAGSALHRLHEAGIAPDIAVFYDPNGLREQLAHLPAEYLKQIIFCLSPFTETVGFEAPSREKFLFFPQSGEAFAQWFSTVHAQLEMPLILEGGGTVSVVAMQLAQALQSTAIVLVGQDLAFPHNQAYAGGISVQQDEHGRLALERTEALFTAPEAMGTVRGQNGENLPALKAYAGFIRHFERMAELNQAQPQPIPLYNASLGGAEIRGYTLMPLSALSEQFHAFQNRESPPTLTLPRQGGGDSNSSKKDSESSKKMENQFEASIDAYEAYRLGLAQLNQRLREAIALHEAVLKPVVGQEQVARQALFDFLNQNPLISHFLMFEMMQTQQRYNPRAATPAEVSANQSLLMQSTQRSIEILRAESLPHILQAEARLLDLRLGEQNIAAVPQSPLS
jgi:hypothetical protein